MSSGEELMTLRQEVDHVHVAESIQDYVVTLVRTTRTAAAGTTGGPGSTAGNGRAGGGQKLSYGASPRACLGLFQASKALAWLRDMDFVTPALMQDVFADVMRHRVGLTYESESLGLTADNVLLEILKSTPVPESTAAQGLTASPCARRHHDLRIAAR